MKHIYLNSSLSTALKEWFERHVPSLNDDAIGDMAELMDSAYDEGRDVGSDDGYDRGYNDGRAEANGSETGGF